MIISSCKGNLAKDFGYQGEKESLEFLLHESAKALDSRDFAAATASADKAYAMYQSSNTVRIYAAAHLGAGGSYPLDLIETIQNLQKGGFEHDPDQDPLEQLVNWDYSKVSLKKVRTDIETSHDVTF